jgi:hypothetical protein
MPNPSQLSVVCHCLALAACGMAISGSATRAENLTVRLELRGRTIEGTPLAFSDKQVTLLARDGQLWDFKPQDAKDFSKLPGGFHAYGQGELRGLLLREFESQFDVSGTGHFLVVHPAGQRDLWAARFEELYRSFVHYFTARGLRPQPPQFPLVAVVFQRQGDFLRYAAAEGSQVGSGTLGYYSPTTNRIVLFDQSGSKPSRDWRETAATIIHEAAHQSAFNTGIHSRNAMPPRWVAEGLGTLFEAPGVWNSRQHARQEDRINRGWLKAFQRLSEQRTKGLMAEIVSSDRLFQTNPDRAYAEAWSLTFFLSESEPRKYFQYLAKTAGRPAFSEYRAPERLRDFADIFGGDLAMLEARYLRFMAGLK